jgi:isochorismate hydrolase
MMERKEDTSSRIARRKYEEKNKEERKLLNKVWGTSIPRKEADKINAFLEKHHLTKVDLIYAGFEALKQQVKSSK